MNTTAAKRIAEAADEGAAKLEHLSASARDAAERARRGASSALRETGARGQELGRQINEHQQLWTEEVRDCIREHPIASVAIAVGAGMLLSRFLSR